MAGLALGRGGTPLLGEALGHGGRLFLRFGLVIFVSFLVAGLAETLMPREWISAALGERSGLRGLLLASAAGAFITGQTIVVDGGVTIAGARA